MVTRGDREPKKGQIRYYLCLKKLSANNRSMHNSISSVIPVDALYVPSIYLLPQHQHWLQLTNSAGQLNLLQNLISLYSGNKTSSNMSQHRKGRKSSLRYIGRPYPRPIIIFPLTRVLTLKLNYDPERRICAWCFVLYHTLIWNTVC